MTTFKQFLAESAHKQRIEVEEAVRLVNAHCRDALKNKVQLYRGMTPGPEAALLHGEAGGRKSKNTSNYYTVILDHLLPKDGYPKRSESIIFTNSFDTAKMFGRVYAVFPYDGVKIGVCAADDLWNGPTIDVGYSGDDLKIQHWNQVWQEYGLTAESYEAFVEDIKEKMQGDGQFNHMLEDIFGSPGEVEKILRMAYSAKSLGMHLATTADIDRYGQHGKARELWASGKCVAIDWATWEKMKNDEHDDELAPEDD